MSFDALETGQNVRQYRKVAGLTQEELAKKVGISTMSIRRYENGERIASRKIIETIAAALGCDPYSLYSWDQATTALEEQINARARVDAALGRLNDAGMEKAADAVEVIAEVPRYRRQEAEKAPPPPPEGTDTTPGAGPAEGPPEGE